MYKRLAFILTLVASPFMSPVAAEDAIWKIGVATRIQPLGLAEAREFLAHKDDFVTAMSPLDRQIRVGSRQAVSEEAFLKYVADQAIDWPDEELRRLSNIVRQLSEKLADYRLELPQAIGLIKTTGKEEAGAPHCRRNSIVMPHGVLQRSDEQLERLLAHELFHILSRNNVDLRLRLYWIIGFEPCDPLQIPTTLKGRRITNPDEPQQRYRVQLMHNDRSIQVTPILLWKTASFDLDQSRGLFDGWEAGWLEIAKNVDGWIVVRNNGIPVIHKFADLPALQRRVGSNTDYVIHPEEILAENFAHLVMATKNLPDRQIVRQMREVLLATD